MNKKLIFVTLCVCLGLYGMAQDIALEVQDEALGEESLGHTSEREKIFPQAKRPQKPSAESLAASRDKNPEHATAEYEEECTDTFLYGLTDEISALMDELTANEDVRFVDAVYDLFQDTKSPHIRQKALAYFAKIKDPCLEDFAVEIINEPYEEKRDIVQACFAYISAVKSTDAIPGVMDLVEKEDSDYFMQALSCLGDIGGAQEAVFLSQFLERDDFSVAERQTLMRVLGGIKATETWETLADVAQDSDEDLFVRCYAAEAIGAMELPESEAILIDLYEEDDPKLREYVIRGLSHFTTDGAHKTILQALKDDNYRVRLEAITAVQEHALTEADKALIYHCKHKEETVVKEKCYKVLAELNTQEGNAYLVSVITDKKAADSVKSKVAAALLAQNTAGTQEILDLAKKTLSDDKSKALRYALGKEFAKYGRAEYAEICSLFLDSKDVATQGTGLDIFAKGKYGSVRSKVQEIAQPAYDAESETDEAETKKINASRKPNANAQKAKRILESL